jgi:hypothetical protein
MCGVLWFGLPHIFRPRKESRMIIDQMLEMLKDLKTRLIAKGYSNPRVVAHFNWLPGSEVSIQACLNQTDMSHFVNGTRFDLARLMHEIETWVEAQPDAYQAEKEEFFKMLEGLPAQAEKLGIELPVKLTS